MVIWWFLHPAIGCNNRKVLRKCNRLLFGAGFSGVRHHSALFCKMACARVHSVSLVPRSPLHNRYAQCASCLSPLGFAAICATRSILPHSTPLASVLSLLRSYLTPQAQHVCSVLVLIWALGGLVDTPSRPPSSGSPGRPPCPAQAGPGWTDSFISRKIKHPSNFASKERSKGFAYQTIRGMLKV